VRVDSLAIDRDARARIVLTGSLAEYLEGGGYWWTRLQYLLGLKELGHDVFWLDLLQSSGDARVDQQLVEALLGRLERYGLREQAIVLLHDDPDHAAESFTVYNASPARLREIARSADLLWNLCGAAKRPLLSLFRRRVLIDLDPGVFQVSGLTWDMGLADHEVFLTVGGKLGDEDCLVPDLGVRWQPVVPFVFLPAWERKPDPGPQAPFSSVTQWEWREMWLDGRVLSRSKREAYLRYLELPRRTGQRFELAANIDPEDDTGDRELLAANGWSLVHPHVIAAEPGSYRRYIQGSRAEFLCTKPIYRELVTGWFSDRSVCYLASGRPVLCEETGFSDHLPTGEGLFSFSSPDEAVALVAEVEGSYARQMSAARELAEAIFDSRRCLAKMLELSDAARPSGSAHAGRSDAASGDSEGGPALLDGSLERSL
jgi:hypothetical protein